MNRRNVLLGLAGLGSSLAHAEGPPSDGYIKDVPRTSVEEMAATIGKDGLQLKFIGRQIKFKAAVLSAGEVPRVRIDGMAEGKFDTAWLHDVSKDHGLRIGDRIEVYGLIVQQDFGVWRIWRYSVGLVRA